MILPRPAYDCPRHLNDGTLQCVQTGPHETHVFQASSARDRHDLTEASDE